ncbi:MAG: tyrosine-type recombinase/integrase [Clostridia bacterium]|nr:tyrosine-type recombinase/integrase [Clostridia bacterium]
MNITYHKQRDIINQEKLSEILTTLPDYVADFFLAIENNSSSLTRLNYGYDIRLFLDYLSGKLNKKIINITPEDLNSVTARDIEKFLSYVSYYEKDGKTYTNKERGKARKLSALRSLFKYLFNLDLISSNVITKISTPKIHQKEIIRLEVDEVVKLLNQAENPANLTVRQQSYNKITRERDLAIMSVFLGTGIRISELVGLNINDIDFNNNSFKITRKGGNEVVLYFSDEVKDAMLSWLKVRQDIECDAEENALFLSLQKKRITPRAVENLVKKYSRAVTPLKKISPHKLRSTYGTNLYRETQDIYVVADVLGHKDVNTTKKHYAAISEDIRRSASTKVKLRN